MKTDQIAVDKISLVRFTLIILSSQLCLLLLPIFLSYTGVLSDVAEYYLFLFTAIILVNPALIIALAFSRPKFYILYIIFLIAILVTPLILVLSALRNITC